MDARPTDPTTDAPARAETTLDLLTAGRYYAVTYTDFCDMGLPGQQIAPLVEHYLRSPKSEAEARDHFARQMYGQTEIGVAFGRVDVVIDGPRGRRQVVEVEPFSSYPNGVRQALAYAAMTDHDAAIAVYGALTADQARSLATRLSGWCALYLLHGDWHYVGTATFAEQEWSGKMWRGAPGRSVSTEYPRWKPIVVPVPEADDAEAATS